MNGQKLVSNEFFALYVDSLGIMLGTSMGIRPHGTADRVIRTAMSISATLFGIVIGTVLYISYYNSNADQPYIDTLAELKNSDLNICIDEQNMYLFNSGTRLRRAFGSVK